MTDAASPVDAAPPDEGPDPDPIDDQTGAEPAGLISIRRRDDRLAAVRLAGRRWLWNVLRFAVRLAHPFTLARAAWIVLVGAGRAVALLVPWLIGLDALAKELRKDAGPEKFIKLTRRRRTQALFAAVAVAAVVLTTALRYGTAGIAGVVLVVIVAAGIVGKRGRRVLVDTPQLGALAPPDMFVRSAFVDSRIVRDLEQITLLSPVTGDGDGWRVRGELAAPYTYDRLIHPKNLAALAGALNVNAAQLEFRRDTRAGGTERRFELWVSHGNPYEHAAQEHPLSLKPRPTSVWDALPIGNGMRRYLVQITFVAVAMLIGGVPRYGKTTAALNIAIVYLLDVNARVWLVDGKGLDTPAIEDLCEEVGDPDDPLDGLRVLRVVHAEIERRLTVLRELGMVAATRDLAEAGTMPAGLVLVDEITRLFPPTLDAAVAKEINYLLSEIVKLGPTVAMHPLYCTHYPKATAFPTEIRALMRLRLALYCTDYDMSESILGRGSARQGGRAHELPADESLKGSAVLVGTGSEPVRLRLFNITPAGVRRVAQAARTLRAQAGVLPVRVRVAQEAPPVLACLRAALVAGEGVPAMATEALLTVLPADLGIHTGADLADAVRPYGLRSRQLGRRLSPAGEDGRARNLHGYFLTDIDRALQQALQPRYGTRGGATKGHRDAA